MGEDAVFMKRQVKKYTRNNAATTAIILYIHLPKGSHAFDLHLVCFTDIRENTST